MSHALPFSAESYASIPKRPLSGLEELCNPDFTVACLEAERQLDGLRVSNSDRLDRVRDEKEVQLNEIFDANAYIYKSVLAKGKGYVSTNEAGTYADFTELSSEPLRYGGLVLIPTEKRNGIQYRTAFRLLPCDSSAGGGGYYAPLENTMQLDFTEYTVDNFNPDLLSKQLRSILQRSREYRSHRTFQKKSQMEKMELIEQKAEIYTAELASFIDQDMPLILNTDRYAAYPSTIVPKKPAERMQFNAHPNMRHIVAGRLVEVTFRSLFAINPNVPPLLVLQNTYDETQYEIPLDAVIANIIPLHATVYR